MNRRRFGMTVPREIHKEQNSGGFLVSRDAEGMLGLQLVKNFVRGKRGKNNKHHPALAKGALFAGFQVHKNRLKKTKIWTIPIVNQLLDRCQHPRFNNPKTNRFWPKSPFEVTPPGSTFQSNQPVVSSTLLLQGTSP